MPNDVSFEGLTVGEKFVDGYDSVTGYFALAGWAERDHTEWSLPVMSNNYLPGTVDFSQLFINPGNYTQYLSDPNRINTSIAQRDIPWFFVDASRQDPKVVFDTVTSTKTLLLNGTTKVKKDGQEVAFALNSGLINVPSLPIGWESRCDPGVVAREEGCNDE